jgi:uncharacterized protein involved in response to NO
MALWLPLFDADCATNFIFSPRDWHAHEMLFSFIQPSSGIFLTAISKLTSGLLQGMPLLFKIV